MKILIIKPSSFGDIIQAAPAANSLRQAYHKAQIDWLVFKHFADVVALISDVDNILYWDRKGGITEILRVIGEVRKNKYDIVIDLQGLLRSAVVARASGAKIISGVAGMKEGSGLLVKAPPHAAYENGVKINATLRNIKAVEHITKKSFKPAVSLHVPNKAQKNSDEILKSNNITGKFIAFIPFARGKAKTWPLMHYEILFDIINKNMPEYKIVVLGSEKDFGAFEKTSYVTDLCGKTDILTLAGVLKKSAAATGADTGPMHLASSLGCPSVFIFGGSDVSETAPLTGKNSILTARLSCAPCRGRGKCKDEVCLASVKPQAVYEELLKWTK
jgi:ADP-heptose:LPS heptosyltransferase